MSAVMSYVYTFYLYLDESGGCMLWVLVFINVPHVLLSHYTVPYDQVSFSDLNIYPTLELSRYKLVNQ